MASHVKGIKEARINLRNAPAYLRELSGDNVEETVRAVHIEGKSNIDAMGIKKRSGRLKRFYRRSMNRDRTSGRVGYLSSKAGKAAFYARFINDGTEKMQARPFHTAAVEKHEGKFFQQGYSILGKIWGR